MSNRSEYVPVECVNIPKILFQEKQYEKLSVDAKLLYSLLLDRKTMANMNGWIDQYGTAYVIYPKSEMKKHLNASRYRVDIALEELEKCGQMVVVTQPNPGRLCQIYVKDITGNYEEDMESDLAYDYRDKEYYSLPRKEQKMMDMTYYGYIDENDEPNDETIMEDSAYLGKQIGTWLGKIAIMHGVDVEALLSYIHDLYMAGKRNQIRSIMTSLALLCGGLDEYIDAMYCCAGFPKKLFLTGACYCSNKVAMDMIGEEEQE